MKKLLFIILLTLTAVFSECSVCFAQQTIHRHSNYTVYEYAKGPVGVFDETTQTWKDTCWVGTPGYLHGKAKPKIIRRTIVKEGNVGVVYTDSSAYYGLSKHILKELEKRGELEMTRPDGNVKKVKKSKSLIPGLRKKVDDDNVAVILNQILADPYGTQVYGVYELKEGGK